MNVLANDGISDSGKEKLEGAGYNVIIKKVAQNRLAEFINEKKIAAIYVRSATTVRKDLIDDCPDLKVIGRGGVGMDNIDVDYAREKGKTVFNTPAASSSSVAELVFAHLYGGVRSLYDANRKMPLEGDKNFKRLKKKYAGGMELRGRTLGIIGPGRIGTEVAKIALGIGMKVLFTGRKTGTKQVKLDFADGQTLSFDVEKVTKDELLKKSDFVTLHIPAQDDYVIGKEEIGKMKNGAGLINAARGGVVDEVALVEALENDKLSFAALDVYEKEPTPEMKLLMHPDISLSPHIGAATGEAQDRIGVELADNTIEALG